MKTIKLFILCVAAFTTISFAQPHAGDDPIGKAFFPPELVMQNQQAIGLTDSQRAAIQKEMQAAQSEFMTLQWDMQKEADKMKVLVDKDNPSETEVSAQLDRLLSIENRIKHRQIALLLRIKNALSAEQQIKLRNINK